MELKDGINHELKVYCQHGENVQNPLNFVNEDVYSTYL